MEIGTAPTNARRALRFHGDRDTLLAEFYARPATPLPVPALATRIAALGGEGGQEGDRQHMVALCRKLGAPEPGKNARWCALDAGTWRLRWERHTEISTWTFYRPIAEHVVPTFADSALDPVPKDWLEELPGEVLVAAHIALLREKPPAIQVSDQDEIAASIADGAIEIFTDLRPGADGFTRMLAVQTGRDAVLAGRVVQQLFEIETYRLLAMLAFPLASSATAQLSRLEREGQEAAMQVSKEGGIEFDRALLNRLAALAGEMQALIGRTQFRFSAARAYYGIVQERIQQLRERRIGSRPTLAEFMERRLAPAMRTCTAIAERQERIIAHIARTSQLLSTRVDVATEMTNANLLTSMNRRAHLQLRLQQTVEGLSVAAISYYALGLLSYAFKPLAQWRHFDPALATGICAPFVLAIVWYSLRRVRLKLLTDRTQDTGNGSH